MESKPKFEPGKEPGTPFKVKLEDTKEFWSKEHPKYGWSFGYNVSVEGIDKTWFASSAVKRIIDKSGVKANQEFILELRNIKDKDGNVKKAWYLDGKTVWEYEDDNETSSFAPLEADPVAVNEPEAPKKVDLTIEERLSALEEWRKECSVNKDGEPIPF
jgi:hypothetical protein